MLLIRERWFNFVILFVDERINSAPDNVFSVAVGWVKRDYVYLSRYVGGKLDFNEQKAETQKMAQRKQIYWKTTQGPSTMRKGSDV